MRFLPYLLGLLTGMVIGLGTLLALVYSGRGSGGFQNAELAEPVGVQESLDTSRRNAIVAAVQRTRRSVVMVQVIGSRPNGGRKDRSFSLGPQPTSYFTWVGSGFVIDDGYVITNEHVVRSASEIVVSMGDVGRGWSVPARLVGTAPEFDLALLAVPNVSEGRIGNLNDEDTLMVPARLGDSDDLLVGEWAIAIGSPFGRELGSLEPSVSVGVISAVERDIPAPYRRRASWPYLEMIQTDAAINDGNSGGPLVNSDGEVIGVNTAMLSTGTGSNLGINFSIPVNTVKWVWQELRDFGAVRTPWIGWVVEELPLEIRSRLRLPEEEGILTVKHVIPGSPAEAAGLRPHDVIRSLNGHDSYSIARANRILFGTPVGGEVEVEVLRDGQLHRAMVHVIENPKTREEREARSEQRLG